MNTPEPSHPGHALHIQDLSVTSKRGRSLLQVPRLRIDPGEAVVIRGPSGAGKSTLLYALAGLVPVAGGTVRWGTTDMAALTDAARTAFRRQHMGFIFQDHLLFEELSAAENAALAACYAPRAARADIRASAARQLERLGLKSAAGRGISRFSGGERQRVAVARALSTAPSILLADEPTASLDRAAADALIRDMVALATQGTQAQSLIVVSHDPAFHAAASRVIDIVDGQVAGDSGAERSTHADLG